MGPEQLVKDLRKELAEGRVLVVAGTGVSIQASGRDSRAGWSGLILDGIRRCKDLDLMTADEASALSDRLENYKNDSATLIEIAERVQGSLAGGELRRWLQESVGTLPLKVRDIVNAIHELGARVATTNYDDLLSRGRDLRAVPWTDLLAVQELIRDDRKGILHFHGYYDEPDSVILGVRSYQKLLEAKGAQAIQQVVAASKTLLFIGCGDGLADPNFGALLEWVATVFPGSRYRHYSLCRTVEAGALRTKYPMLSFIEYGASYEELAPALRELAPPRRATSSLPAAGHCFGREREVKELVAAMSKKTPEPIPILGGPGMGKTTIALRAIHDKQIVKRFGKRRWFVRCDGVKTRAELAAAVARALSMEITPDLEPRVLDELANGRAALILDNAETPLDADAVAVGELLSNLAAVDSLALAVTIRGQYRPITVAWGKTIEVNRLSEKAASQAFIAAAGKPAFAKDPNLARLLAVLDGVPLAITLMGRFAESFKSLEHVWDRWSAKKTAMLSAGPDRLTNIEISYELSIGALTPDARRLLSVLAMLPDGVAHVDLPAIFADPERAADELRNRALIEHEEKRIRMLAPLREHVVAAHLPEAADEGRVVLHYLGLVAVQGDKVGAVGGAEAVARLAPEVANMEAMFSRSAGADPAVVKPAVYGLAVLMRFTGLGSTSAIEGVRERASAGGLTKLAARCIQSLGDIALARSDHETARARYEEAQPLYRKLGDLLGEANCIRSLGDIALRRSVYETARARYEEAQPLYRKLGDLLGEANCIKSLGDIALRRSDHETARTRYEKAQPLFRKVGDLLGEANCIRSLGDIALARSDHETARARYEEAQPLFRKVGSLLGEANCIHSLGNIALERSDHETARARYEEAQPLYQKVGDLLGEANCIASLGDIARDLRNAGEAESRYREALALYERIAEPYSIGTTHRRLARLASDGEVKKKHVDAAREAWRSIRRDDLVAELDAEFGGESPSSA